MFGESLRDDIYIRVVNIAGTKRYLVLS